MVLLMRSQLPSSIFSVGLLVLGLHCGCAGRVGSSSTDGTAGTSGGGAADSPNAADAPVTGETWELDGKVVATHADASGYVSEESGRFFVMVRQSRDLHTRVQLDLGPKRPVPGLVSCRVGDSIDTLNAADDGLVLPPEWLDRTFEGCDPLPGVPDTMSASITVDEATLGATGGGRISAHYDMTVVGAGPRAGHTLRVHGIVTLTAWGSGP